MSSTVKAQSARTFFGPRGALSRWHPNYEFRRGQLEMAEAVEAALLEKRHLIVEAGTASLSPSPPVADKGLLPAFEPEGTLHMRRHPEELFERREHATLIRCSSAT